MTPKIKSWVDYNRALFEIKDGLKSIFGLDIPMRWKYKIKFNKMGFKKYFSKCWDMAFYYSFVNGEDFEQTIMSMMFLLRGSYIYELSWDNFGFSCKDIRNSKHDPATTEGVFNILLEEYER